jgi:hypothetical protein
MSFMAQPPNLHLGRNQHTPGAAEFSCMLSDGLQGSGLVLGGEYFFAAGLV